MSPPTSLRRRGSVSSISTLSPEYIRAISLYAGEPEWTPEPDFKENTPKMPPETTSSTIFTSLDSTPSTTALSSEYIRAISLYASNPEWTPDPKDYEGNTPSSQPSPASEKCIRHTQSSTPRSPAISSPNTEAAPTYYVATIGLGAHSSKGDRQGVDRTATRKAEDRGSVPAGFYFLTTAYLPDGIYVMRIQRPAAPKLARKWARVWCM